MDLGRFSSGSLAGLALALAQTQQPRSEVGALGLLTPVASTAVELGALTAGPPMN